MLFFGLQLTLNPLRTTKIGQIRLKLILTYTQLPKLLQQSIYSLPKFWIVKSKLTKNELKQENSDFIKIYLFSSCQKTRKIVYAKAENWPVMCYYEQDKVCRISRLFEIVNMGKIQPKRFGPRTHFGSPLLNYNRSDPSETGFKPDISGYNIAAINCSPS